VLLKDFDQLGFSADDLRRWQDMTRQPNGIILVTGPTGSGKTTTLYTTLKKLATPEVNLCTIEDPIEMVEPAFNQMQVQHNIDLSFRRRRARADAAGPGHHHDRRDPRPGNRRNGDSGGTHRPPGAVDPAHQRRAQRHQPLLELGVPHYLIKATVLGVMAQRLVRTLCPHCKAPLTLEEEDWQTLTRPGKRRCRAMRNARSAAWSAATPVIAAAPGSTKSCN
jgi:general secretion pathway protein E